MLFNARGLQPRLRVGPVGVRDFYSYSPFALAARKLVDRHVGTPCCRRFHHRPGRRCGQEVSHIPRHGTACVNIVPGVESVYWWEGKVDSSQELLLIAKTLPEKVDEVAAHVKARHLARAVRLNVSWLPRFC